MSEGAESVPLKHWRRPNLFSKQPFELTKVHFPTLLRIHENFGHIPFGILPDFAHRRRARLHFEELALRQHLAMVTHRDQRRFRFRPRERLFWVCL